MADIHHYVTQLLQGAIQPGEPPFTFDENFRALDRDVYIKYLPDLCRFIAKENEPFKRAIARLVLQRIIPDAPDLATATCLLEGLQDKDPIISQSLLSLISVLRLPQGTDLEPIRECIRKGDLLVRQAALKALRAAPDGEGELTLLEVLRRTDSTWDIQTIAGILANIGGLGSLPVLMARLEDHAAETNKAIHQSLEKIALRLNLPASVKEQLSNPEFWKIRWQGTKENFVGFMSMVALMSGYGESDEDADQLAEVFREEMQVNIEPFKTYRELRLCSGGDEIFSAMAALEQSLESRILLDVALHGTGISESHQTQAQNVYFNLLNDYLFTRLRRRIRFADDDF
ncbi:hypothetical protein GR160_07745 [Flavobacterium sp. Sd200]|uniref:HEAT repeat domain-containing protein n=1 Tax=Flavobacterium sp. Sd200 TaxID=2692211 RepID=UPI00136A9F26|nr:hypothetical protein [Flavobacterium sp. Sd200]MXN91121.1 hypothetical protein [Flavobacterium sp. Sd200]